MLRFAAVVGKEWAVTTQSTLDGYLDPYAIGDGREHAVAGVVAPASTEEVQAVMRIANERRQTIWPISRGKNYGYGSAAPVAAGTVMLDLSRMNRIIDIDEKLAYCVLEPGVGFYDLYDRLQAEKIKLWISPPGNSWGSVIGNALEHGNATTPYGDHAFNLCGLEVVLADGDRVRTNMGAMGNGAAWHVYKHAFGPGWDQMFTQSNFGIVTRAGFWMMPEPEASLTLNMELPEARDIEWAVETLGPLRTAGVIRQSCSVRNYMRGAALNTQRSEWFKGQGALPESVVREILKKLNIGWWNVNLRLYGLPEVNEAHARLIQERFSRHTDRKFQMTRWRQGEPMGPSGRGEPTTASMQMLNWTGGRGAHVSFSPSLPLDGKLAREHFERAQARMREFGFDFYGSMFLWERSITVVSQIFFDRDDAAMLGRLREVFPLLIKDAAQHGYGEYRTHIDFMDAVAQSFDYNNHALTRLNQSLKAAVDPNGIIAPGKQGIWPKGAGPAGRR